MVKATLQRTWKFLIESSCTATVNESTDREVIFLIVLTASAKHSCTACSQLLGDSAYSSITFEIPLVASARKPLDSPRYPDVSDISIPHREGSQTTHFLTLHARERKYTEIRH